MSTEDRPIKLVQVIAALVIVALGVGVVFLFKKTAPEPERGESEDRGLLVETVRLEAADHAVHVRAQGQVTAARRVVLSSQVAGKITWVSEALVPGGRLESGARLLRLDGRDYQLALQSRNADVNRAALELQLEQRRQAVAEREWESFGDEVPASPREPTAEGRALALRQPQVETAEVGVEAARGAAQQARLNLQRTTISAPFNAMVLSETVDVGQYVAPGAQLATLVGTDDAWVQVALPLESLGSIQFPEHEGEGEGSVARVTFEVGGRTVIREGHVLRLLPDLEASGGMARVLVSIRDPFAFESAAEGESGGEMPLLLGSYVTVDIDVPSIPGAIEVPRLAVREGNEVYVMNGEDQLEVRRVRVVWGREDTVLVGEGLADGEKLITSRVPSPVDGLRLREAEDPAVARSEDGAGEAGEDSEQ